MRALLPSETGAPNENIVQNHSNIALFKGPVTYLLKPLLGKNFGGVAWTPFVMHWSFYSTVLPGDMQI